MGGIEEVLWDIIGEKKPMNARNSCRISARFAVDMGHYQTLRKNVSLVSS
jgi:hypothetical protein